MCNLSGNEVSRAECNILCVPAPELCRGGTFSSLLWELMQLKMWTKPPELYCATLRRKQETD